MSYTPNFFIDSVTSGFRRKRQNDRRREKLGLALFERPIIFVHKPSMVCHTNNLAWHLVIINKFFEFLTC
jgi:hypothetical protein